MVDIAALSPCGGGTFINEVSFTDVITVAPNPANESTSFNMILRDSKMVNINVFDITGKLIDNVSTNYLNKGVHTLPYNTSKLNSGIYIYKVETGKQLSSGKLIVK